MNLLQQINEFETGKYTQGDHNDLVVVGWYDWFCSYKSLVSRTKRLYKQIKQIQDINNKLNNKLFDPEKVYISLKNCCPMEGELYDVIRIFSLNDDDKSIQEYVITPKSGFTIKKDKAEICIIGKADFEFDNFKDLLNYLKTT